MKKISVENMSAIQGGDWCNFNRGALAVATASLYLSPFTGGGTLAIAGGLLAFVAFVGAAYSHGSACR